MKAVFTGVSPNNRWAMAIALWIALICAGFGYALHYAATPGRVTRAPDTWPASTSLTRADGRHTLLMFVHAHCACTRASLAELDKLLERLRGRVSAEIVFIRPEGTPYDLVEASMRAQAAALPDTRIIEDTGDEARRFGAQTSGAVVLYDVAGRLVFSGGLTSIRGHEGNSFGQERIVALVTYGKADRSDSPVFGCSLETTKETP